MDIERLGASLLMVVNGLFYLLDGVLFVRVFLTWIPGARDTTLFQIASSILDPFLSPIQRMMRKSPINRASLPIDFSPVILVMFFSVAEQFLTTIINGIF